MFTLANGWPKSLASTPTHFNFPGVISLRAYAVFRASINSRYPSIFCLYPGASIIGNYKGKF